MIAPVALAALSPDEWWTMGLAACCALACALPGCYLVLRGLSMLGDAISHAVLPGIATAFLLSGSRNVALMLAGAAVAGVATALLSAGVQRAARTSADAALGVVFTSMFALGVVLMAFLPSSVDIDPGCVLYGHLEFAAIDRGTIAGLSMPRSFPQLAGAAAVAGGAAWLLLKELRVAAFDPALARAMGVGAGVVHVGTLVFTAGAAVVSFEAVGSILVIALLVGPAASARLLTDRFGRTFAWAAFLGVLAAVVGCLLAVRLDASPAGVISVVVGCEFALAAALGPRHGVLAGSVRRAMLRVRIAREDMLGRLYRVAESGGTGLTQPGEGVFGRLGFWSASRRGEVRTLPGGLVTLTERGNEAAKQMVRTHRLWEAFLSHRLGLPADHLHEASHRAEHFVGPAAARELAKDAPATDPHGRPIP